MSGKVAGPVGAGTRGVRDARNVARPGVDRQHRSTDSTPGEGGINPRLPLGAIRTDGGTQIRATIIPARVWEYADEIAEGAEFPPVTVFFDGDAYWLVDGFHRYEAHAQLKRPDIAVDVRQGTLREAMLFSVGVNATHGERRSNEDKRRAVRVLLDDPEWSAWGDRDIARRCGVSHTFVAGLRPPAPAAPSGNGCQIGEPRKVERGGTVYVMHPARIGKPPAVATGGDDPDDGRVEPAEAEAAGDADPGAEAREQGGEEEDDTLFLRERIKAAAVLVDRYRGLKEDQVAARVDPTKRKALLRDAKRLSGWLRRFVFALRHRT